MNKPLYQRSDAGVVAFIRQVFIDARMLGEDNGGAMLGLLVVREEFLTSPELASLLTERTLLGEHIEWHESPRRHNGAVTLSFTQTWGSDAAERRGFKGYMKE